MYINHWWHGRDCKVCNDGGVRWYDSGDWDLFGVDREKTDVLGLGFWGRFSFILTPIPFSLGCI